MSERVFIADGVNADSVAAFIKRGFSEGVNLRAMQIFKSGKPQVRVCMAPYGFDMPMQLYSLSKSFTSVAVGICCDKGLLSPDTVVSELFADRMPENLSDDARSIKLSDLLSMQSGHDECKLYKLRWADDAVRAFFEIPLTFAPGTTFRYNTAATLIAAACVERVSGMKTVDFLYENLFSKLGITKPRWRETADGSCLGGTGLYLSSDDISKFALMLANKGVYGGERIVSEEYLALATSKHSLDVNNGSPDWVAGYGFQFWLNARGGYRGDGAFGQLILVFPERDLTVTYMGEVGNMATEMSLIYDFLDSLYGPAGDVNALRELAETAYMTAKNEGFNADERFTFRENGIGLKTLRLYGENLLHVVLGTDYGVHEFVCGNGDYILNRVVLHNLNPNIGFLDPDTGAKERVSVFAAWEKRDNGVLVTLRHADTCHVQRWTVGPDALDISVFVGDLPEKHFSLEKEVKDEL